MRLRRGDTSAFITRAVLRPLVERGYLTWHEAGWTGDPDEAGTRLVGFRGMAAGREGNPGFGRGTINRHVERALIQFQQDSGISHRLGNEPGFEHAATAENQISSGVVGRRTLAALGTDTTSPETQRFIAKHMRVQAARAELTTRGDGQKVAERVSEIRRSYPQLDAKVTAALALAGHGLDDPVTKTMIGLSMQRDNRPFWSKIPHDAPDPRVDQFAAGIQASERMGQGPLAGYGPRADYTGDPNGPPKPQEQGSDLGPFGVAAVIPSVGLDVVGDVVGVDQLGDAIRTPLEWANQNVVKPAVRGALTAAETPYQAVTGEFRNQVAGAEHGGIGNMASYQAQTLMRPPLGQTSGGIVAEHLAAGEPVDQGSGYFPSGQVAKQQAERSRQALSIDGHAATPGRFFASQILEPGSKPYNVVSGAVDTLAITTGDPANYLVGGSSEARRVSKIADVTSEGDVMIPGRLAGLIPGVRRDVNAQQLEEALTVGNLRPFAKKALIPRGEKGHMTYNEFRRAFKGDATSAAMAEQATNTNELLIAMDPRLGADGGLGRGLGTTIREVPKTPYTWRRVLRDQEQRVRGFGMTPGNGANLSETDDFAEKWDRLLRSAKVSPDQRNELGSALVLADGRQEKMDVLRRGTNAMRDEMRRRGIDPHLAEERAQLWQNLDDERHYLVDLMTGDDINAFLDIGDARYNVAHPSLDIHFLNDFVPFPDARELRRMTSNLSRMAKPAYWRGRGRAVIEGTGAEATVVEKPSLGAKVFGAVEEHPEQVGKITNGLDKITRVWKGITVATPKTGLRVATDEQARVAASGHWDHPFHMLNSFLDPRDQTSGLGHKWIQEAEDAYKAGDLTTYARARAGGAREWSVNPDERLLRRSGNRIYNAAHIPDQRSFDAAWHTEIQKMHTSEIASRVARLGPDEVKRWLADGGEGHSLWQDLTKRALDPRREVQAPPDIGNYVDTIYQHLIDLTQGDDELLKTIATGTHDGKSIARVGKFGSVERNADFTRTLRKMRENGNAPSFMPGPRYERISPKDVKWLDSTVDKVLNLFMTMPSNRFNRSPMFFQTYWDRAEELLPMMDEATRREFARNAIKNGRPEFAQAADRVSPQARTILTAVEADDIAKGHALGAVRQLLYDVQERGNVFDAMRNLVPFGEAWREVVTRWARIAYERPQNLRRLQVAVEGARGADPLNTGQGFLYTDPTTHQEMFVIPGSEWITKKLTGLPIPFVKGASAGIPIPIGGSATGLNMIASGLPGAGPSLQVPAGLVLPDNPDWDWLRNYFDPYGTQQEGVDESKLGAAVGSLVPAWAKRALQAVGVGPEKERMYATAAMATYLKTSGKYPDTQQGMNDLLTDAKQHSRAFWLVRLLGSALLPTAPLPQYQVVDKKGRTHILSQVKDDYYRGLSKAIAQDKRKEYDQAFIGKVGLDTWGELTPLTETAGIPLPRTKKQTDWTRRRPWIAKDYPYAYGFFAPSDPNGQYDPKATNRQLHAHERFTLTPEEQRRTRDDRIGWQLYNEATDGLGTSEEDYAFKRKIRTELRNAYPGWRDRTGLPEKVDRERQLEQVRKAVKDPRLSKTPFAKGMREYLDARDWVQQRWMKVGGRSPAPDGWQTSRRMAQERADLVDLADTLRGLYPETASAFDTLFRNELGGG